MNCYNNLNSSNKPEEITTTKTKYLKYFSETYFNINFPVYDPKKLTAIKKGIKLRISVLTKPLNIYMNALVTSTPKSIAAEVAIKVSFPNSNAINTNPLIAPPEPITPAKNPEILPPKNIFIKVFF